jgi:hypothetical protein
MMMSSSSGSAATTTGSHGGGSSSATRYMVGKSMSGAVGSNILNQAISKMKENNKYIGSTLGYSGSNAHQKDDDVTNTGTAHTTPNTKHQYRYGH